MTDREILKQAIGKALDNGWKADIISKVYRDDEAITSIDFAVRDNKKHMDLLIGNFIHNPYLLFSHDFAKAFWPERYNYKGLDWAGHLMKMVVSKNPIQYLKQFIDGNT